jgi:hypothetical protein
VQVLGGKELPLPPRCANFAGYSLHAGVGFKASDRAGLQFSFLEAQGLHERADRQIAKAVALNPAVKAAVSGITAASLSANQQFFKLAQDNLISQPKDRVGAADFFSQPTRWCGRTVTERQRENVQRVATHTRTQMLG